MTIKEFKIQYALGSLSIDNKINLAGNESTSKEILSILSIDKNSYIRGWIAENPNTPINILKKLSKDEDWCVKYWVTCNHNAPKGILEKLSTDENKNVRDRVNKYVQKLRKEG